MKNKKLLLSIIAVILVFACAAAALAISAHLKKEAKWNALVENFNPLIDYTIVEAVPDFTIGNTIVD